MPKKNVRELKKQEGRLLCCLAGEWEKTGPPGYIETSELSMKLNISISQTKSTIRSLFVLGLVDSDEIETYAAYLTPEGYELARALFPENDDHSGL
jgi:RIO-like serine/threonine protein kinase